MKKVALNLLAWLAGRVIVKYKVKIVAVTGSVGKTTAKEAIYAVLQQVYYAERSLYNANTEWGIAASVITPGFEPIFTAEGKAKIGLVQYCQLIWQAKIKLLFRQKYPQVLVLELAADRPGDISWFNRWLQYDVAVITTIGNTHLDFYKNQAELTAEKLSLTDKVKSQGLVVINGECENCREFIEHSNQRKVTFGWENTNDLWPTFLEGQGCLLHHHERSIRVQLPVGRQFVPAALMAYAVGEEFGLTDEQIQAGLSQLQPLAGRFMIHRTPRWVVIDDTYNAAPESTKLALESLGDVATERKVAILGEMRELGDVAEQRHREIGAIAAKTIDLLITTGAAGKLIAEGALMAGMPRENILILDWQSTAAGAEAAWQQILPRLKDGDTVLIKASRTIYLDKLAAKMLERAD